MWYFVLFCFIVQVLSGLYVLTNLIRTDEWPIEKTITVERLVQVVLFAVCAGVSVFTAYLLWF